MKKVNIPTGLRLKKSTIAGFNVETIKGGAGISQWDTCTCSEFSLCPPIFECY